MISTIQGRLADGARRTIVHSYRLDLESEIELWIQVQELLLNDADLSKVIDDTKSWFTQMEVRDLIYLQLFFMANSLGRPPTTSQFIQLLTRQTLALVTAAIHCALSAYATGKKVTFMYSQDEYWGKICLSTVIDCITAEATELINYTLCAASSPPPPWCSSAITGAPQSPSALLSVDSHFDISFSAPYCLFCWRSSCWLDTPQSPPRPRLGASLFHSRRFTSFPFTSLPFQRCSAWMGCSAGYAVLGLDSCPSSSFHTPPSPSSLPLPTLHSTSGIPPVLVAHHFSPWIHNIAFQAPSWYSAS